MALNQISLIVIDEVRIIKDRKLETDVSIKRAPRSNAYFLFDSVL